ncbi:rho-related GTP-binding protein RhoF isoform X2 [Rhincodon typus]|uniref:rho-related GTP-binding protein RhoF isoform X2 n=1 Tax=Rhincodon typus TaxID=259920 RepID=UPI00202F6B86|nr:rho-related GTP-binding protein RhoF isoform X2 [Rhincodon typus]
MAMENGHNLKAAGADGKELKIVIVGDGGCGKTSLLMVFAKGDFPEQYAPSVFEKYVKDITVRNKKFTLTLYDTAGQEDYDRLRPLSYQDTNIFLICYDVTNPTSFDNVRIKWVPEVSHFCQGVPIFLIGCKTDLRMDKERLRRLRAAQQEPITYNEVGHFDTISHCVGVGNFSGEEEELAIPRRMIPLLQSYLR